MAISSTLRKFDRIRAKCRAIHVARRQLDLDDTSYRNILMRSAGVRSSSDIHSVDMADAVLDALSRLGFKLKTKTIPGKQPRTPATLDREPYLQKIGALLADMELPWAYAEKIAENITGGKRPEAIKRLAWLREDKHFVGVISALHNEKTKRLNKLREELGRKLAEQNLTPEWALEQAIAMERAANPWPWHECLETLRLIIERLNRRI